MDRRRCEEDRPHWVHINQLHRRTSAERAERELQEMEELKKVDLTRLPLPSHVGRTPLTLDPRAAAPPPSSHA